MAGRIGKSIALWRSIEPRVLLRLALAAFFLFGTIGLVSILIDSSIRVFPWRFVVAQTVALGAFGASIVLVSRTRWWITMLVIIFWGGVLQVVGGGLSFVYSEQEGLRVRLEGLSFQSTERTPSEHDRNISSAELNEIYVQRGVVGGAVIVFLIAGYALFVSVVRHEVRRRAGLQTEIQIAGSIQESLLPPRECTFRACAVSSAVIPASDVGGDYLDIMELPDGAVALAVADVTGHGVGAGIVAAMTKSALRTQLLQSREPGAVLHSLNLVLNDVCDAKTFVTFAYAVIDPGASTVTLATAGHPPILFREGKSGKVSQVRTQQNPALGMQRSVTFAPGIVRSCQRGDAILLYTDGVLEASNAGNEQFGLERLERVFGLTQRNSTESVDQIIEVVKAFSGKSGGFDDDVTVLCVAL